MVVETWGPVTLDRPGAQAKRIVRADQVQIGLQGACGGEWTVVGRSVVQDAPRLVHAWKALAGDLDHGIALSVLEQDVVVRVVLLDQVVLEHERLVLVSRDHVVDVVYPADKRARLGIPVGEEVAGHAPAQILRLADVDHLVVTVLHHVDAALLRQGMRLVLCTHLRIGKYNAKGALREHVPRVRMSS